MTIAPSLFASWRYACAGDGLIFRSAQYRLTGGHHSERSALLRDLLALANGWAPGDAYVVIGIDERAEKPNALIGIDRDFDATALRRFVNSMVATPCAFEYLSHREDGQDFGILRVPRQARPVFLERDYADLAADVVYVRRGREIVEARPTEIAAMGGEPSAQDQPDLRVEFYDPKAAMPLGRAIDGLCRKVVVRDRIPDFVPGHRDGLLNIGAPGEVVNRDYHRDLFAYISFYLERIPVDIHVSNAGAVDAEDVTIEIAIPASVAVVSDVADEPPMPRERLLADDLPTPAADSRPGPPSSFEIERRPEAWIVRIRLERLAAGSGLDLGGTIYLKALASERIVLRTRIGDAVSQASVEDELLIDVERSVLELTWDELEEYLATG